MISKIAPIAIAIAAVALSARCGGSGDEAAPDVPKPVPAAQPPPVAERATAFRGRHVDEARDVCFDDGGLAIAARSGSRGTDSYDAWILGLGQAGESRWQATLGGKGNEEVSALAPLPGGLAVVGWTLAPGADREDAWAAAVDRDGAVVWERLLGGPGLQKAEAAAPAADGGLVVAGSRRTVGGVVAPWVARLDPAGSLVWERVLGEDARVSEATAVAALSDGGFVAAGSRKGERTSNDGWIARLDATGSTVWERTFGGDRFDVFESVTPLRGGGFACAGHSQSNPSVLSDAWIVSLDPDGNASWEIQIGSPELDDRAFDVAEAAGGDLIVVGRAGRKLSEDEAIPKRIGGGVVKDYLCTDLWIARLGDRGALEWERRLGGNDYDGALAVSAAPGGERFAVAGIRGSVDENGPDAWVLVVNGKGEIEWEKTFGR